MPGSFQVGSTPGGVPTTAALPAVRSFSPIPAVFAYGATISGTTKDANGNALASCALVLYRTADDSIAARGVSDASGVYRLGASTALVHYLVAYKAGSPDVAGTSVNTLVGT